jgi:hypothetical protein
MTGFSRRTRRLLIGATLLLSLSAVPRSAEAAGTPEECFFLLGSFCFANAAACDAFHIIPQSFCDQLFLACVRAAGGFCFGLT